jgi:hypothetical protein
MNITDRVKQSTHIEEAAYRELQESIRMLQATQRKLAAQIDAGRMLLRPNYPTAEQCKGIIEAVRRFKAGEATKSTHGDPVGPAEEPYAVRYSQQVDLGWMHVAHGSPLHFDGDGHVLWTYTEEEIAFIVAFVEDQGVEVGKHWRSDGGLSLRFRESKLDPKPWFCTSCSDRFVHEQKGLTTHVTVFKPREKYVQEQAAYLRLPKDIGMKIPNGGASA